ncbi:MAG: GntR family transcriptional regulator [Candidatus Riflebacteria bacterium]|nr:GntR family transcriptional regulator [Candidatus Riflebacteria bacterium]
MRIPINRQSKIPLYKQIEVFLRQGILSGSLESNSRLPAIRRLAHDLGVNRITVECAYAKMEAEGLIYTKIGSGTYVLPTPSTTLKPTITSESSLPLWQKEMQGPKGILNRIVTNPIFSFGKTAK